MTEMEAIQLIELLKQVVGDKNVYIPLPGKKEFIDIESIDPDLNEKFDVVIYKAKRPDEKCSFIAMYCIDKTPLLRIDVGGPEHTNPDGTKVSGDHMHIFKDGNEIRYAIEFDVNNKNLVGIALDFFKEFNVIPLPTVYHQTTLFS